MAYPTNYNGKLNANEIFASLSNMIISQQVFANDIKRNYSNLINRVDGSMYGDTKLYVSTDALRSYPWGNDAEATKLLELERPEDPQTQSITLDTFRQIRLTVDEYLTKRAWMGEGSFSEFNSVMLGRMQDTKFIYDVTLNNVAIGTIESAEGKQEVNITLPTVAGDQEAENRLQAQTIAAKVADVIVDLKDVSRDYNDYQNIRAYTDDEFKYVWNASFVNKINKLDLPTIFNKDFIDKFAEETLPARYFGKIGVVDASKDQTADGSKIRSLVEQDVTLTASYTYKGKTLQSGSKLHLFAGDIIPSGIKVASKTAILVPFYTEDETIVCKLVHKSDLPYMSAFEAGTNFFNPRSLTDTKFLTFGHNTIVHLHDKPIVTIRAHK